MTHIAQETHGWQLEDGSATAYERHLVPVFMAPWALDLVEATGVSPGERVADVACGTGIVARHAAERVGGGGEVTGIDVNPAMLAVAREQSVRADVTIRWEQAPADDLPLPDASCDVVLCQQGLQFFPDRRAALAELFRIATTGGRLGLSVCRGLEHQPGYALLTAALTRHAGEDAGAVVSSPYVLGDAADIRALVEGAGFVDVHVRIAAWAPRFASAKALLRAETMSSPLGELVARLDPPVQKALVDDLTARFVPHTDDDGILFPFQTLVVTARR